MCWYKPMCSVDACSATQAVYKDPCEAGRVTLDTNKRLGCVGWRARAMAAPPCDPSYVVRGFFYLRRLSRDPYLPRAPK